MILDHIFKKVENLISVQFFIKDNQLFIFCYPNTNNEELIKKMINEYFEDEIIKYLGQIYKKNP